MRVTLFLILPLCLLIVQNGIAQKNDRLDVRYDTSFKVRKRPMRAAAGVVGLNISIWAFDRHVLRGEYAYVNWTTIKSNFRTGFVWDTDNFSTNLLFHPLHGSYYFNIARSNGLSFWESTPYTWGGSLMWEFFLENEPPSINDVFSTSAGGMALGEISFRLSSIILDDSKTGVERVARECLAAVVSPMRMFNRLSRGELGRTRYTNSFQRERSPFSLQVSSGWRYLPSEGHSFFENSGMFADLRIDYGSAFDNDSYRPFEYFSTRVMLNLISTQQPVASINALGILWGKSIRSTNVLERTFGVFQHFDYYQTNAIKGAYDEPLQIAQTAAFGIGFKNRRTFMQPQTDLTYNAYVNAILMGGVSTDHFKAGNRNYDLGSGYGLKLQSKLANRRRGSFYLGVEQYHLFTWKGYEHEPNPIPTETDIKHLNVQGNTGNTLFVIVNPRLVVNVVRNFSVNLESFVYLRRSYYRNFPNVNFSAVETCLSLAYTFK